MKRGRGARPAGAELDVAITALGAAGDGIAETAQGRVFVPLALPGEQWRVRLERRLPQGWRAAPLACLAATVRATPPCPHFGRCGGCRLQHLPPALYLEQKRGRVQAALAHRGLPENVVGPLRVTPPASRRRLRLGIARAGRRLVLGFRERGSHRLEPISVCPVACPELAAALTPLAEALATVLDSPEPVEASLTLTEAGIDLLLHADRPATRMEHVRLAGLADGLDLARVSWIAAGALEPEPIVTRRVPVIRFGQVPVEVPSGSFLQATAFGEAELALAIAAWSHGAAHAIDLFAGLGTLTFAMAPQVRRIRAVEGDAASAAALLRAARAARLFGVQAEARDLVRRPLMPAEIEGCDLVVLDPPRVGASEQVQALAAARAPKVIYAACSPESFARDARVLVDAGLELVEVRPIDQFLYAADIELIALFAHPAAAKQP